MGGVCEMNILFIWFAVDTDVGIQNGIAQMSACLKREGHNVRLIMINADNTDDLNITHEVDEFETDVVCFSITALQRQATISFAKWLRPRCLNKVLFVAGGVDVILDPEFYKQTGVFNYLCIGEGEKGIVELANGVDLPTNFLKNDGRAGPRDTFHYTADTPAEDYDIFPWHWLMTKRNGWLGEFFIGRGCPHSCHYCSNHAIRAKLFPNSPRSYIRFKQPEKILFEIQWGIERYESPKMVVFGDDLFTLDINYMEEFLPLYKARIGLPFVCNIRVGSFNHKKAKLLQENGCFQVKIGIEHGNYGIRKGLLNRHESNAQIEEALLTAKEYGLSTSAFLMIGVPTETPSTIMDTLKFVAEVEPDRYKFSVFYPFPGTVLYDYCVEHALIDNDVYKNLTNYSSQSGLVFDEATTSFIKSVMGDVAGAVNKFIGKDTYVKKGFLGYKPESWV
jgi:anaerobic magnesium-protoporphyrin IX monomethyl ester cyclase